MLTASAAAPWWIALGAPVGALLAGLITFFGVVLNANRQTRTILAAEQRRHENAIVADRETRRAAAVYETYAAVSKALRRLLTAERLVASSVKDNLEGDRLHVPQDRRDQLDAVHAELIELADDVFLVGSDQVHDALVGANVLAGRLRSELRVAAVITDKASHQQRIHRIVNIAEEAQETARRTRELVRAEVRHGELGPSVAFMERPAHGPTP